MNQSRIHAGGVALVAILSLGSILSPCAAGSGLASASFDIVASQFHQRDIEDAGEARICVRNTGPSSLSMAQFHLGIATAMTDDPSAWSAEQELLYARLLPPVLRPQRCGLIVAKLVNAPPKDRTLICTLSAVDDTVANAVPLAEPLLWISYVGFSADRRHVFVYAENQSEQPVEARLLKVAQFDADRKVRAINNPIPPGDKACLVYDLPSAVAVGDFVHVALTAVADGHRSEVHTVVRVIDTLPVATENDAPNTPLGLDAGIPFVQTMTCPAHAHGTHAEAASLFLEDYVQRFSVNPHEIVRMHVCVSEAPRAWFRFGSLPDVATMNPCQRPPSRREELPEESFCSFFQIGRLAKRAMEPHRYMAVIPSSPDVDGGYFFYRALTPPEYRFVVYSAVASGVKGLVYRGLPAEDALTREAFTRLNRELQFLRDLLQIGEPVDWADSSDEGFAVKSLLCGDQAIVVLVLDRRYFSQDRDRRVYTPPFGRGPIPMTANVKMPGDVSVQRVRSLSSVLDSRSWDCREETLRFHTDMIDSVQVYVVHLKQAIPLPDLGGLSL